MKSNARNTGKSKGDSDKEWDDVIIPQQSTKFVENSIDNIKNILELYCSDIMKLPKEWIPNKKKFD